MKDFFEMDKESLMTNKFSGFLIIASAAWLSACAAPNPTALLVSSTTAATLPAVPPATCPITLPAGAAFIPPAPYPATPPANYPGQFWYGTAGLWTLLRVDGTWANLPLQRTGYSQKLFWWREGYSSSAEPNPNLTVTGKRLDAPAASLTASRASNAMSDLGQSMDVGIDIPTAGCWEITGQYNDHKLSFVVWVAP
jgi:hypothetical protein